MDNCYLDTYVAPLAGSVDRNFVPCRLLWDHWVAPLAGSVDRNITQAMSEGSQNGSLPSRGAWIEITIRCLRIWARWVAPLAGSVDRNANITTMNEGDLGRSPRGERG